MVSSFFAIVQKIIDISLVWFIIYSRLKKQCKDGINIQRGFTYSSS